MGGYDYSYYPEYVSVAEKRARAKEKLNRMKKKNPDIKPVVIEGNAIAVTWWGKEWNHNLERYADYSNRIGRGRSYVRHGAVLHLDITPGKVEALVQGSCASPYKVTISIKPIPQKTWDAIKTACKGKIQSLQRLIGGSFPKDLALLFTRKGEGLFPSPQEISFDCSCPDWASMCKHVAAVLYGVGSRLDQEPGLFFVLRKVDKNDLISEAVAESKNDLLEKASRKSKRVLAESVALSDMFGIDLDNEEQAPEKEALPAITPSQIMDLVEQSIKKNKNGLKVSNLIETTRLEAVKIRNAVTRLKQQGKIESVSRGVYRLKKIGRKLSR